MENEIMVKDYPESKQRVAVCHSQYDENEEEAMTKFSTFCFSAEPGAVDREAGTIMGISILTAGEAKGHNMMISQKTLESSITLLTGKSLPAYLSHKGAMGDRLLTEAGYFSGFFRNGDQIRARKFTALESFKKYEPEKFERLFEIAEVAPHTFGVSIVFEGQLFWEMSDGSEQPMDIGLDAPENSRFDVPTVRPLTITSADFVDTPAANGALFSDKVDNPTNSKDMTADQIELGDANESASAHHEADEEKIAPAVPSPDQPKPKKKSKKKALAEQDEDDREDEERGEEDEIAKEDQGEEVADEEDAAEDRDDDEKPEADELEEPDDEYQEKMRAAVEEVYTHIENAVNRLKEVMDMVGVPDKASSGEVSESMSKSKNGEVAQLKARVEELAKLHSGTAPIKEKTGDKFATVIDAKKHLIKKHLEANPQDSGATAVLAIAKTNPELFQQN